MDEHINKIQKQLEVSETENKVLKNDIERLNITHIDKEQLAQSEHDCNYLRGRNSNLDKEVFELQDKVKSLQRELDDTTNTQILSQAQQLQNLQKNFDLERNEFLRVSNELKNAEKTIKMKDDHCAKIESENDNLFKTKQDQDTEIS